MTKTIEDKQLKLEQQQAKLIQKAQTLRSKARKIETKKLISLGQLIKTAELDELDADVLLGGLLSLKERSADSEIQDEWRNLAAKQSSQAIKSPYIITYQKEISDEIRQTLKSKGFKWNQFRKEWQGLATDSDIEDLSSLDVSIESIVTK